MESREVYIDRILKQLIESGSDIHGLQDLRRQSLKLTKKDIGLSDVLETIAVEIKEQTEEFLNSKNQFGTNYVSGISACIYMPNFNGNGEYKLKLVGGNTARDNDVQVDENTLFDVASITKLYTLLLLFKLEELGLIDLNEKVKDINPNFQNLEDFTLNDLVRLHGELRTNGNIVQASSQEEAYEMLKSLYLLSNSREENKYTDFGAIVIGDTIEQVVSKKMGKEMTYAEIMETYLLKPLGLHETVFNPETLNISGNGNELGLVHDPKARILGGAVGHAGLFISSDDLAKLSRELYSVTYINRQHIRRLGEITFPNSNQNNKGNLGIYVKHPLGYAKTFTPPEFSTGSFSHQGWTGAIATFDPNNLIHNNILVNAIYQDDNKDRVKSDKPTGFGGAIEEYQKKITYNIILMYVAKQYYNRYCNQKEDINNVHKVKSL